MAQCSTCNGSGKAWDGQSYFSCPSCGGIGAFMGVSTPSKPPVKPQVKNQEVKKNSSTPASDISEPLSLENLTTKIVVVVSFLTGLWLGVSLLGEDNWIGVGLMAAAAAGISFWARKLIKVLAILALLGGVGYLLFVQE